MALEGTLKDFSLADIFQLIGLQRKTGILILQREGDVITVSFENGMVVGAEPFKRSSSNRLGSLLIRSGRITREQLEDAIAKQKETLQKLGYILVDSGYIPSEGLREALQLQIKETIYRLFRWKDGKYKFSQEQVDYNKEMVVPLSTEHILMEGIRMLDEWPIIEKRIPSFDLVFKKVAAYEEYFPEKPNQGTEINEENLDDFLSSIGEDIETEVTDTDKGIEEKSDITKEAEVVFNLVDGKRNVQEIMDLSRLGEFEACKALYDLLSLTMIEIVSQKKSEIVEKSPQLGRLFKNIALYGVMYLALIGALIFLVTFLKGNLTNIIALSKPAKTDIDYLRIVKGENEMSRVSFALEVYYLENENYPSTLDKLVKGDYLRENDILDPWGKMYQYQLLNNNYSLSFLGSGNLVNVNGGS